jgi:hypothetical protein
MEQENLPKLEYPSSSTSDELIESNSDIDIQFKHQKIDAVVSPKHFRLMMKTQSLAA